VQQYLAQARHDCVRLQQLGALNFYQLSEQLFRLAGQRCRRIIRVSHGYTSIVAVVRRSAVFPAPSDAASKLHDLSLCAAPGVDCIYTQREHGPAFLHVRAVSCERKQTARFRESARLRVGSGLWARKSEELGRIDTSGRNPLLVAAVTRAACRSRTL